MKYDYLDDLEKECFLKVKKNNKACDIKELKEEALNIRIKSYKKKVVLLDGKWEISFDNNQNIYGEIPGSIHTALYKSGKIPDPYFAGNDIYAREASFKSYILTKKFLYNGTGKADLEFGGICENAEIYLNDVFLGQHRGMFSAFSFKIDGTLVRGENIVKIKLFGAPNRKRKEGELPIFFDGGRPEQNLGWLDTVVFNCSYGWHYANIPPLGIWRSVKIIERENIQILDPFIKTENIKGKMNLSFLISGKVEGEIKVSIKPENFKGKNVIFSDKVFLNKEINKLYYYFNIPNPQLWWPNGYGKQNLYLATIYIIKESKVLSSISFKFGIRTIEMKESEPKGVNFYKWLYTVNDEAIFMKGAGWCTLDAIMRFSKDRYKYFLSLAKMQNLTMLRAWGGGMPETDEFYELCDKYGICVFQEWPMAWGSENFQPIELLLETVKYNVKRLRNHPSLLLWCGGNEGQAPLDCEVLNKIGKLTLELDDTRPWHRQDAYGGSLHNYCSSWGYQSLSECMKVKAVFLGEFGIDSFPNKQSIKKYLPEKEFKKLENAEGKDNFKEIFMKSPSLRAHTPMFDTSGDMSRLTQHVTKILPFSSINNVSLASQIAQGLAIKQTLENARVNFPLSTGAIMYKLNDNYPTASWSTIDWYGTPKFSYYAIKQAFESFCPVLNLFSTYLEKNKGLPVYILDDNIYNGIYHLEIEIYGREFKKLLTKRYTIISENKKVIKVGEIFLPDSIIEEEPVICIMRANRGKKKSGNIYYLNFERKCGCLFSFPKTEISFITKGEEVEIKNEGRYPALGVSISGGVTEKNYFYLSVKESKRIKIYKREGKIEIRSWNV